VIETAHDVGLPTTATIMFGHVDSYQDWATHLRRLRDLQKRTGGFTEIVPLPFVAFEAPLYKRGSARPGPTFREAVLMHAVARLTLFPLFANVQASWVKEAGSCRDARGTARGRERFRRHLDERKHHACCGRNPRSRDVGVTNA
jgi:2-iminoacetate synthase ThiH